MHWDWNWNLFAWSCFLFLLTVNGNKMTNGMEFGVSSNCGWRCSKGAESAIPLLYKTNYCQLLLLSQLLQHVVITRLTTCLLDFRHFI